MNARQNETLQLQNVKHFILGPQNGQNGFRLGQRKNV